MLGNDKPWLKVYGNGASAETKNVYPLEVEEVHFEHPEVVEAVAVGVPDEYRGESVKAFVVRKSGSAAPGEEIVARCQERLAPYETPKAVEFRDELPKSAVGKLLLRVLAAEEREKAQAPTAVERASSFAESEAPPRS